MNDHDQLMKTALDLAEIGRGAVEPNPMVGAVIVKDNKIIGRGYHEAYGLHHAEVNAINDAGSNCKGATLYVTLEPCAHYGKTPPCVQAISQAGIKRVYIAVSDSHRVEVKNGAEMLKEMGVEVYTGILEDEARELNAPFFKLIEDSMPYITAKWAMSLDGRIATHTGDSRWISSDASRAYVHKIRGCMDGVMIGVGTAIADDPLLTCRGEAKRVSKRIIVDSKAKLPLDSKLVKTVKEAGVIVAVTSQASEDKQKRLQDAGCEVLVVEDINGLVDLRQLLKTLGQRAFTNILVEGGGRMLGSLFDNSLVDKAVVFIAPKVIGGKNSISPVSGEGFALVSDAVQLDSMILKKMNNDIVAEGVIKR